MENSIIRNFLICTLKRPNKKGLRCIWHEALLGSVRNAYKIIGRLRVRKLLRRPRHSCEDNIKITVEKIAYLHVVDMNL
jgi:hypothetical protein